MILAFDIGGANTKIALIENKKIVLEDSYYFPLFKYKNEFKNFLFNLIFDTIIPKIEDSELGLSAAGITMTAELSDAFTSKCEGVNFILNSVENALEFFTEPIRIPVYVLSNNLCLITIDEARKNPYLVASANWAASAWYAAKKYGNGILVDTGSTTTDIIPIKDGEIKAKGKTDLKRLRAGELIYTGILRTNVSAIVNSVKVNNKKTPVSSELFAATADVYLILNEISEKDYTCETADLRGKSKKECISRLARVVCCDTNELSEEQIVEIAKYVRERQIQRIIEGIEKVKGKCNKIEILIGAGAGTFLLKEIAGRLNISLIESGINPAGALGLMVEEELNKNQ